MASSTDGWLRAYGCFFLNWGGWMPRRGCEFLGLHRKFCFFAQIQLASPSWLASPPVVYKECLVPLFVNHLYFPRKSSFNMTFLHVYTDYSGSGWATALHTLLGFPQSPRSPIGFLCWKKLPIQIDHFWALIEKSINKWIMSINKWIMSINKWIVSVNNECNSSWLSWQTFPVYFFSPSALQFVIPHCGDMGPALCGALSWIMLMGGLGDLKGLFQPKYLCDSCHCLGQSLAPGSSLGCPSQS